MAEQRYRVDPTTGCWEWLLGRSSNGYGSIWVNGRSRSAHRFFYEQAKGEIPAGMHLDHLCRNRGCVNPEHLEAVTCGENIRRGRGAKLNWDIVADIRRAADRGVTELARAHGISQPVVTRIRQGSAWPERERPA